MERGGVEGSRRGSRRGWVVRVVRGGLISRVSCRVSVSRVVSLSCICCFAMLFNVVLLYKIKYSYLKFETLR